MRAVAGGLASMAIDISIEVELVNEDVIQVQLPGFYSSHDIFAGLVIQLDSSTGNSGAAFSDCRGMQHLSYKNIKI